MTMTHWDYEINGIHTTSPNLIAIPPSNHFKKIKVNMYTVPKKAWDVWQHTSFKNSTGELSGVWDTNRKLQTDRWHTETLNTPKMCKEYNMNNRNKTSLITLMTHRRWRTKYMHDHDNNIVIIAIKLPNFTQRMWTPFQLLACLITTYLSGSASGSTPLWGSLGECTGNIWWTSDFPGTCSVDTRPLESLMATCSTERECRATGQTMTL